MALLLPKLPAEAGRLPIDAAAGAAAADDGGGGEEVVRLVLGLVLVPLVLVLLPALPRGLDVTASIVVVVVVVVVVTTAGGASGPLGGRLLPLPLPLP